MQSNADPSSSHRLGQGVCFNLAACCDVGVDIGFGQHPDDDACRGLRRCQVASSVVGLTRSVQAGSSKCRQRHGCGDLPASERGCLETCPRENGEGGGTGSVPPGRGVYGYTCRQGDRVGCILASRYPGRDVHWLAHPVPSRFSRGIAGALVGEGPNGTGCAGAGTGAGQWTGLRAAQRVCGMSGRPVRGTVRQEVTWLGGLVGNLRACQVVSMRGGGVASRCGRFLGHPLRRLVGSTLSGAGGGWQRSTWAGPRAGFLDCRCSRRPCCPVACVIAGGPVGGVAGRYA